jgi:hypothetical protein
VKKFVIEREIPKIGSLKPEQMKAAATKSNEVLRQLGPDVQWLETFVAADKTFCIYLAKDESIIRQHAELSGLPANRISEIAEMIDPATGAE